MLPNAQLAPADFATTVSKMRQHHRVDLKVEVTLHSESNFYNGFSVNISEGGLFIATHDYKPIGSVFTVGITLPDGGGAMSLPCEVRWVREFNPVYPDTVPGMGVNFLELNPEDSERVQDFVDLDRDPIFFDDEDL